MDAIVFVLRTSCPWNALNDTRICSSSAAHRRFQEWIEADVFLAWWRLGLLAYDALNGMDWEWLAMDGAMTKAPLGAIWGRSLENGVEEPWPDSPPWAILRVSTNLRNRRRVTLSSHSRMVAWTTIISTQLPTLSAPHATVLALWRVGMVLARSCALTAVAAFLAPWWRRPEQHVRQQLREWSGWRSRS
jgi:hypothetical protein